MALGTSDTLACHGSVVCLFANPSGLPAKSTDPHPLCAASTPLLGSQRAESHAHRTPTSPLEKA